MSISSPVAPWQVASIASALLCWIAAAPGFSAMLGAIAVLLFLNAAQQRRHVVMLACFGIAAALDPNALLLAPLTVALVIRRRIPVRDWPAILIGAPIALIIAPTPAALAGPTLWAALQAIPPLSSLPITGLATATTIGVGFTLAAHLSVHPLADRAVLPAASFTMLATALLLPAPDIRAVALASVIASRLAASDRRYAPVALMVVAGAALAIAGTAFSLIPLVTALWLVARDLLAPAANDNMASSGALIINATA